MQVPMISRVRAPPPPEAHSLIPPIQVLSNHAEHQQRNAMCHAHAHPAPPVAFISVKFRVGCYRDKHKTNTRQSRASSKSICDLSIRPIEAKASTRLQLTGTHGWLWCGAGGCGAMAGPTGGPDGSRPGEMGGG